jgi:hypothetical protein
MSTELIAAAARLRRAMLRNAEVIAVCDGLDRALAELSRVVPTPSPSVVTTGRVVPTPAPSVVSYAGMSDVCSAPGGQSGLAAPVPRVAGQVHRLAPRLTAFRRRLLIEQGPHWISVKSGFAGRADRGVTSRFLNSSAPCRAEPGLSRADPV